MRKFSGQKPDGKAIVLDQGLANLIDETESKKSSSVISIKRAKSSYGGYATRANILQGNGVEIKHFLRHFGPF